MPRLKAWDKWSIKAEIGRRGESLDGLDRKYKLPIGSCRAALQRPFPSADRAISRFLGIKRHFIWPDRYDDNGKRIYSRRKRSTNSSRRTSQKRTIHTDTGHAA